MRSSYAVLFLERGVLKICRKFTGETHAEGQSNFIEIVNLLHIFRTPFPKTTSGWLLLIDTTEHFREILYLLVSGKYFVNTLSVFIIACLVFYLV